MIIFAVHPVSTAAPSEEKAVKRPSSLVKKVGSSIAYIQLWVAPGKGSLLVFFVFGTDVLAVPEVILLIPFLVGIIIGQRCLHLFSGRPLKRIRKGQIFLSLVFDELLGNVLVDIAARLCCSFERSEISLDPIMQLLGQLPGGLAGLRIEVVVFVLPLIVVDLVGLN